MGYGVGGIKGEEYGMRERGREILCVQEKESTK
jgi:hypothetical protein